MTQENQTKFADEGKTESKELATANTTNAAPVEPPTGKKANSSESIDLKSTEIDNAPVNNTSPISTLSPSSSEQNLPTANNQQNKYLIQKDKKWEYVNEKKYELFLISLKDYGGQICNEIIQITNLDKNFSNKNGSQDFYNNPLLLFRETYNRLKNNPFNLLNHINEAYEKVNIIDQSSKQIPLPLQFILGIMLKAYKENLKADEDFDKIIKNETDISIATCYNYLSLTRIIERMDDNRIFSLGLKNLYKLSSLIDNDVFKDPKIENEIINMLYNLTNANPELSPEHEQFTDEKFQLAVEYIIFYYNIGVQSQLNREYFSKLYDASYKWTKADVEFIKERSVKTDQDGKYLTKPSCKYEFQLNDSKFIDTYMEKLIENNFNGKITRKKIKNAPALLKAQKTKQKSANPYSINMATGLLTETIGVYMKEKREVSKDDMDKLKELQSQLNAFIENNTPKTNGEHK